MPLEREDPYNPTDEQTKMREYKEFVLPDADERSLRDIELVLKEGRLFPDPKGILEFLESLGNKIYLIKQEEVPYEGHDNKNLNAYLLRIKRLMEEVTARSNFNIRKGA